MFHGFHGMDCALKSMSVMVNVFCCAIILVMGYCGVI